MCIAVGVVALQVDFLAICVKAELEREAEFTAQPAITIKPTNSCTGGLLEGKEAPFRG